MGHKPTPFAVAEKRLLVSASRSVVRQRHLASRHCAPQREYRTPSGEHSSASRSCSIIGPSSCRPANTHSEKNPSQHFLQALQTCWRSEVRRAMRCARRPGGHPGVEDSEAERSTASFICLRGTRTSAMRRARGQSEAPQRARTEANYRPRAHCEPERCPLPRSSTSTLTFFLPKRFASASLAM